jgi:hypothetical protein
VPEERMTDGEIRRAFERLDKAFADLASRAVTQDAWSRENTHLLKEIADVDTDCRERTTAVAKSVSELKAASRLTVGRILAILAILATLLTGWWAAIGAAKGIH